MSRYIDADAMESTLQQMEMITAMSHIELGEEDDDVGEISMPMFTVRNIMKTAPSIDIVMCKECKHLDIEYVENEHGKDDEYPMCLRFEDYTFDVKADDFCSYGERKDNE